MQGVFGNRASERAAEQREKARRDSFKREAQLRQADREKEKNQILINKYAGAVAANGGVAPKWALKSEGAKLYNQVNQQFQASIDRNKEAIKLANSLGVDTTAMQQQYQAGLAAGKLASAGFAVKGVESQNIQYQKTLSEAQKKFGPLPSSVADELKGKSEAEQRKFLQAACLIGNCMQPVSNAKIDPLAGKSQKEIQDWARQRGLSVQETKDLLMDYRGPSPTATPAASQINPQNGSLIPTTMLNNAWALDEMSRIKEWADSTFVNPLGGAQVDFKAHVDLVNGTGKTQDVNMLQWAFLNQTNLISNVTYTNGIRNNKGDATKTATQIASATGGIITLVHNPTWTDKNNDNSRWEFPGALQDMADTRNCQIGLCGESAKFKLTDMLRLSGGNLFMTGHSQGTTIMANAIKTYKREGGDTSRLTVVAAGAVDSMPSDVKTHYVYETNNAGLYDNVANPGKIMPILANPFGVLEYSQTNFDINLARTGLNPNQDYTRINSGATCRDGIGCHSADVIAEYLKLTGTKTQSWIASDGITRYGDTVMTKKENSGGGFANEIKNASYYCAGAGNCSNTGEKGLSAQQMAAAVNPRLYQDLVTYAQACADNSVNCGPTSSFALAAAEENKLIQSIQAEIDARRGQSAAIAASTVAPRPSWQETQSTELQIARQKDYSRNRSVLRQGQVINVPAVPQVIAIAAPQAPVGPDYVPPATATPGPPAP